MSYNQLFSLGSWAGTPDSRVYTQHLLQETGSATVSPNRAGIPQPQDALDHDYRNFGGTLRTAPGPTSYLPSSIDFDGTNEATEARNPAYYRTVFRDCVHSILCWIRLDDLDERHFFAGSSLTSQERGWTVAIENFPDIGTRALRIWSTKGAGNTVIDAISSDNAINDTNWHHIAICQDTSVVQFYVDGVLLTTNYRVPFSGGATLDSARTVMYGRCNRSDPLLALDGKLADFVVGFEHSFTQQEVDEHRLGPEPYFSSRPSAPTGTPNIGSTLTANPDTIVDPNNGPIAYVYQWYTAPSQNGAVTDIPGATESTYTLTANEALLWVGVKMTPSNSGGIDEAEVDVRSEEVQVSEGPGPTFKPAWASQATQILGRGHV